MTTPSRLDRKLITKWIMVAVVTVTGIFVVPQTDAAPQQQRNQNNREQPRIYKARLTPHWFADNTRFWYRNDLRDGVKEFVSVDAEQGTREAAFDHVKLAAALSKAVDVEYAADHLPFDSIAFVEEGKMVAFKVDDKTWEYDPVSDACSLTELDIVFPPSGRSARRQRGAGRRGRGNGNRASDRSPDGEWTAFVKDHNVFIRSNEDEEIQLSEDGTEEFAYGRFSWSPDSKTLISPRRESGDHKEVYLVESSPDDGGRARLRTRSYDLPGDKLPRFEVNLFNIEKRKQIKPEVDRFEHGWYSPRFHWSDDGQRVAYEQIDRGHQRFRVIEVEARTGDVRFVIDEKSETFIWTAHKENVRLQYVNWMENTDEILYVSERDGWRHLYLIDVKTGTIINQITKGEWVVRGIDRIDEEKRQVWFQASGMNADQDPYFIHYYRINFDGSGLVALTEGNGNHTVQYSPDRRHLIDTWSRVDSAPVHALRNVSDGHLSCKLEGADIADFKSNGWRTPEVFVAKGRDGTTDIWGNIHRPQDFDPTKKYPIIEDIYAGPHGSFVPKSFSTRTRYKALTDLGFIVVKIDGMGTANRSKAFHDVCWKNIKDGGFEDRILWMKAAAAKYPYMDLSRVGVYGNSAGGQNAAAAVLFYPEFYQVAVSSCGCHDNRMDKASWNEQWMGYMSPDEIWNKDTDNWYSQSSNIDNAGRLEGELFLIVGELDNNVPPESTMRLVDALIKADKEFDLLVIPGGGHGMGGRYGQRRMQNFFVRHLLDPNASSRNKK